jgi:hypothetical protein
MSRNKAREIFRQSNQTIYASAPGSDATRENLEAKLALRLRDREVSTVNMNYKQELR